MTRAVPPLDPRRTRALQAERQRLWAQASSEAGPWSAGSGMVSGVLLFGGLGALVDHWLAITWVLPVGVLVGTGVAMMVLWFRYGIDRSPRR